MMGNNDPPIRSALINGTTDTQVRRVIRKVAQHSQYLLARLPIIQRQTQIRSFMTGLVAVFSVWHSVGMYAFCVWMMVWMCCVCHKVHLCVLYSGLWCAVLWAVLALMLLVLIEA